MIPALSSNGESLARRPLIRPVDMALNPKDFYNK
jgi:hypothetical protein